ncbi:MAG: methanogenesis marker 16 metalloprotein [Candidatus Jordarchaeales archaeon]
MKNIDEINAKILSGDAVVLTAEELKRMIRGGEEVRAEDIDVVTTATCAVMSGTAAILVIPVAERGAFERAEMAWLNGVPAFPGPCPNERLGVVDVIVYGTASASRDYGGGHLFRDLVEGKTVEVRVEAEGRFFEREVTLADISFARMFTTRSAFRNYAAMVNTRGGVVKTIFSVTGLRGPLMEATVSGSGEVNPIENDPALRTIGVGTRVLLNGAVGYIVGEGTRSSAECPNVSVVAEMRDMDPEFMGGFVTSAGPECITSVAVPIPVLDEQVFRGLKVLDEEIKLPVKDVNTRVEIAESSYARVWQDAPLEVKFDAGKCRRCTLRCEVEEVCPTRAFSRGRIDRRRCFNCLTCVHLCPMQEKEYAAIEVEGVKVPIVLRQSDRSRANRLAMKLKRMIEAGKFLLTSPLQPLRPPRQASS